MTKGDYQAGKETLTVIGIGLGLMIIVFTIIHFAFGVPIFPS